MEGCDPASDTWTPHIDSCPLSQQRALSRLRVLTETPVCSKPSAAHATQTGHGKVSHRTTRMQQTLSSACNSNRSWQGFSPKHPYAANPQQRMQLKQVMARFLTETPVCSKPSAAHATQTGHGKVSHRTTRMQQTLSCACNSNRSWQGFSPKHPYAANPQQRMQLKQVMARFLTETPVCSKPSAAHATQTGHGKVSDADGGGP